jgi:uncharacterized protein (DUF1499 family)
MKTIQQAVTVCVCFLLIGSSIVKTSTLAAEVTAGKSRLAPCPESPNCVSSADPMDKNYVEPLRYAGNMDTAYRQLVNMIGSQQRARIVVKEANYLRAEVKSAFLGFVDDVEFLFLMDQPVIHVRSASRVGYYDFGVNRRRIEDIRNRWNQDPGY